MAKLTLFTANHIDKRMALWVTDGTDAGTFLLKGVHDVSNLIAFRGKTLFSADDGVRGSELWVTNGTEAGTFLLKDINPGATGSTPQSFKLFGDKILFTASDGINGSELWITDGTAAGTVLLKDINPGGSANPTGFTVLGDKIYFAADGGTGAELWVSDGTAGGTVLLKEISAAGSSSPANFSELGGKLVFTAADSGTNTEVWITDGTASGTVLLKEIYAGTTGSAPASFVKLGETLVFAATSDTSGRELWVTDGTAAGTTLLANIAAGTGSASPTGLMLLGNKIVFSATSASNNFELWATDGTTAGTKLLKEINPTTQNGQQSSTPTNFTLFGDKILFSAAGSPNNFEPWITDGTTAGTMLLKDIRVGNGGSRPTNFVVAGDKAVFKADGGLWITDGTSAGTVQIPPQNGPTAGSGVSSITVLGDRLIFSAEGNGGTELWASDGTAAGTAMLKDINPGGSSTPGNLVRWGDKVYFSANDGMTGTELWVTDGTAAGTVLLKDIAPGSASSLPYNFTPLGNKLLFNAYDINAVNSHGAELWVTDGTPEGTVILKDIWPGSSQGSPDALTIFGDKVLFVANDGIYGRELWITDGTAAGTQLVKDVNTVGPSNPTRFTVLGDKVLFQGLVGTVYQWFATDGTAAGTIALNVNAEFSASNPVALNGKAFFAGNDSTNGTELWTSDGTVAGTVMIKNIASGATNSLPDNLTAFGDKVVFSATNDAGTELWITDGTDAGTVLLKDIVPGSGSSSLANFKVFDGKIFFSANDGSTGAELWVTDGTTAGTMLFKDIQSGSGSSSPGGFVEKGGKLYFTADDGGHGNEIWVTDGTAAGTMLVKDLNQAAAGWNATPLIAFDNVVPAEARNDAATTAENHAVAIDVLSNEIVPDGATAPSVARINGAAGTVFTLASGAQVTINQNGTLSYDPHGAYDWLISTATAAASGASNVSALDSFTYTLATGSTATVQVTVTGVASAGDRLVGTAGAETITGSTGNDIFDGQGGADYMVGGAGNDIYYVDNAGDVARELANQGYDIVYASVSYSLVGQFIEELRLTGTAVSGTGTGYDNTLFGNALDNILDGGEGNDTIDGGTGADRMIGGLGNDIFYIDNAGDVAVEGMNGGTDTVNASVSYSLAAQYVENLVLAGSAAINGTGNALNNALTGNSAANTLDGGGGDDIINGGGGIDTMIGGLGNDIFYVDQIGDIAIEQSGQGNDTVYASVNYSLAGQFVETLVLTGGGAISGTGNKLANTITGNGAANAIDGGEGNDTIDGGGGADMMIGGLGDDIFYVDQIGDIAMERANEGNDLIYASISYSLSGQYIERLTLTGGANIDGTGTKFDNVLTGNSGDNQLHGGMGADTLTGGGGADGFWFDTYLGGTNIDTIIDFAAGQDKIHLDGTIFTSLADGTLDAGALTYGAIALEADDRILYDSVTGNIYYDEDGSGSAGALLFAKVTAGTVLTNADFLVHQPNPLPTQEPNSSGAHRVPITDISAAVDEIMGLASDAQAFGDPGDAGRLVMTPELEAMTAHHGGLEILAGFAWLQPQQHEVAFIL